MNFYKLCLKWDVSVMNKEITNWKDLENKSILLKINDKDFYGTFYIKNQKLFLNINMTNDIEEWRSACNDIKSISATFIENKKRITLLNCMYSGHSSTGYDPIINASVIFWIDRVLLEYDLKNYYDKFINSISVEYNDISWFTNQKVYKNEILKNSISITPIYKEYKMNDKTIIFDVLPSFVEKENNIKVTGIMRFTYVFKTEQNIDDALQYVYLIKNLLMLLCKRNINVITQNINEDVKTYELIDCITDKNIKMESQELIEHLNHRNGFKIEDLKNITLIIEKFEGLYERLTPLLELYYSVVKYNVPNLTRFVNGLTMLENYSREFDDTNALALTITKKGKKSKNGADYVDRVKSLIININSVFNLSSTDIDDISKKIKDARTYYVHYDNSGLKLDENEIFKYVYFIEDIVILNIYLLLGIDISKIKYVSYNDYYYDVTKLI